MEFICSFSLVIVAVAVIYLVTRASETNKPVTSTAPAIDQGRARTLVVAAMMVEMVLKNEEPIEMLYLRDWPTERIMQWKSKLRGMVPDLTWEDADACFDFLEDAIIHQADEQGLSSKLMWDVDRLPRARSPRAAVIRALGLAFDSAAEIVRLVSEGRTAPNILDTASWTEDLVWAWKISLKKRGPELTDYDLNFCFEGLQSAINDHLAKRQQDT